MSRCRPRRHSCPSPVPVPAPCPYPRRLRISWGCKILMVLCCIVVLSFLLLWYMSNYEVGPLQSEVYHLKEHIQQIETNMAANQPKEFSQQEGKGYEFDASDAMRKLIKEELELYNADKTGRTDFALESSGGSIVSTRKSESYGGSTGGFSLFGIPVCQRQSANSPRALIQANVAPGECWAFRGSAATAVIRLIRHIYVTAVTIEHIASAISPTGDTTNAPKHFSIYGLQHDNDLEGFFFGQFTYRIDGPTVQYFQMKHQSTRTYDTIEFRVHSNHGHPDNTCVYRLRVHGEFQAPKH